MSHIETIINHRRHDLTFKYMSILNNLLYSDKFNYCILLNSDFKTEYNYYWFTKTIKTLNLKDSFKFKKEKEITCLDNGNRLTFKNINKNFNIMRSIWIDEGHQLSKKHIDKLI